MGSLMLLGVVSCVVKAPESAMCRVADMAPDSWTASKEGRAGVDRAWVRQFRDERLNQLVAQAMVNNPDMQVAAERVKQAQHMAYMAGSDGRPTAKVLADGDRRKIQFVGFPFAGSQISNSYSAELSVSWEPDLWGRVKAGRSAALADAQAAEMDQKAARASLAGEVCKAYFALAEANEQLRLAERNLKVREESVEAVRSRFEKNLSDEGGSASQLRLSQTEHAVAAAEVARRQSDRDAGQRRLELLVGRYPAGKVTASRLQHVPGRVPVGLPSELLQRRPDVLAAERRYAATTARIKEAKRAVFPSLRLTSGAGTASDGLENLLNTNLSMWSLAGNVTQNLLTGGLVKGEMNVRKSKEIEGLASLRGVVLKAFGEVENALVAEKWLSQRMIALDKAQKLAHDAAEAAAADFREGNGDVLTLLTAQGRHIEISSEVLTLRRMRLENRVQLHLALGGEFQLKNQ